MSSHIINDPVHRVMVFNETEKDLIKSFIDTDLFQRLRRIKQLGCGDLIFPGAVHTRFNHCLGASYLAKRLYQRIRDDLDLTNEQKNKEQNIIMIAALLHDIGHGPFSHAFEKLFDEQFKEKLNGNAKKIKECKISHDDDWLKKFLREFKYKDGLTAKDIEGVLLSKNKSYLSDIISSQLDVDRMDYLLRDSHFCGVPYGKIDLKWIISCASIVDTGNKKRLGISRKGVGALEHYILARRLMTRNIYYHGKIKAAEYFIREFLHALIEQNDNYLMNKTMLGKFLNEYNKYSSIVTKLKDDSKIKAKKEKFINKAFKYYSKITDDDIWYFIKQYAGTQKNKKCFILADRLMTRSLPHCYAIDPSRINKADSIVKKFRNKYKKDEQWKIYLDHYDFVSYKTDKEPIYIKENNSSRNILHASTVLNLLSDRGESTYFLYLDKLLDAAMAKKILKELKEAYCLLGPEINSKKIMNSTR